MTIEIIKDPNEYQENIFMGMTIRQVACGIGGIIIITVLYMVGKNYFGTQVSSYIAIGSGLPVLMVGFFRPQGMAFGKFIKIMFRFLFSSHRKRVFTSENSLYRTVFKDDKDDNKKEGVKYGSSENMDTESK